MRVILAESGQDLTISLRLLDSNESLKQEIERLTQIKPSDQILLAPNGIQLKDDKSIASEDSIVLFNRRLLQNPTQLLTTISNYDVETDLITSNRIPSLQEIEDSLISTLENEQAENIEIIDQLKSIIELIIDSSNKRKTSVENLTKEISLQSVALGSALSNLETHVRTAYHNIGKFDRIAQREFAKHNQVIQRIQVDFQLIKQIQIHPRILTNITPTPSFNTLDQFVPLQQLESIQADIVKQYNDLVNATLEQKNKVTWLNQQTANVSVNRTTSDMVTDHAIKLQDDCTRYMDAMIGLQKRIMGDFNRRRRSYGMDGSSTITIRKHKKDALRDAFRSLYLHMSNICKAQQTVVEEKKTFLSAFIKCMQSISQVEESISQIYPRLADLEKRIKILRVTIDRGNGATAKRIIKGYGTLLIEFWRRDKYSEIATKNASLLSDLFDQFGKREERYRKSFVENEVVCLQDENIILSEQQDKEQAIIPFQIQDMNEAPVLCQTFTTTQATDSFTITKNQVEEFIQMVHSFYQKPHSSRSNRSSDKDDLSILLKQKLERESKRLNKGLVKLGLPNGNAQAPQRNNSVSSSSTKESISSPLLSRSISTPTSTSVSQYYTPDMKAASPLQHETWSQDYRRQLDEIQFKHEKDRQILLQELHAKDKLIQEIQENHYREIQEFQQELKQLENSHLKREQELQSHYEATLNLEQEKFERRFLGFHQRMHAKDKAYATLEAAFFRETKSAPTSPPTSPIKSSFHPVTNEDNSQQMKELHEENEKLQAELSQLEKAKDQIIQTLEKDLRELKERYATNVTQLDEQLSSSEKRWKNMYMAENKDITMRAEARVDNLIAEHRQAIKDIHEAHQREQQILEIKHQAQVEKVTRELKKSKKEKAALSQEFSSLKREELCAVQVAKELLSITGTHDAYNNTNLADLLRIAIGNITNLQAHTHVLEQSMETHPSYFGY